MSGRSGKAGANGGWLSNLRPPGRRGLLVLAILVIATGAAAYWLHDTGFAALERVRKIGWSNLRVAWFLPDDSTTFTRPDGVDLFAYWYRPEAPARGGVVLLHGNTPLGQRLGLYRLLGSRLAGSGYVVLGPDFAGFGGSGDPFQTGAATSLDPRLDVATAVNELERRYPDVPIHVIAHSGGAIGALGVALTDRRIRSLVLIGPPRRVPELLEQESQRDYFFRRAVRTHRAVYGHGFPDWYDQDDWYRQVMKAGSSVSLQADLRRFTDLLQRRGHVPLLVIDNGWEDPRDLEYMDDFMDDVSEPSRHVRIGESDHYLNAPRSARALMVYDATATEALMEAITQWLEESAHRPMQDEETTR